MSFVNFFCGGDRIIKEANFVVVVGEMFQVLSERGVFLVGIDCCWKISVLFSHFFLLLCLASFMYVFCFRRKASLA